MPEPANKAVFLSYSRDDAAAARRVAEALRASGIEVWFDENELRGGDAWDTKIRRQINDCTLFVCLISRNTEARSKGYFRLEWKLAVEQTHMLLEGTPFIVPVVIDDVPESAASVPSEFMKVQWTRLPGALPTPHFVEQVGRLLSGPLKPASAAAAGGNSARVIAASPPKSKAPLAIATVAIVAGLGVAAFVLFRKPAPAAEAARTAAPVTSVPAPQVIQVDGKSIAVLPFENMSEDKDAGFFADGVHEDLLTTLALVPELKVISRTSVMHYRGTAKTIGEIGRELHVAYILEGSVRRSGNKVRVTGQLINARTDQHVWAKNYDKDLTDVFAIQTALSQEIATALSAAISPDTQKLLERKPTTNSEAYDAYLRGRDIRNRAASGMKPALVEAEKAFERAVRLDPNFAAAWGELADVDAAFIFWGIDGSDARLAKGDAAIMTANRLAADDPDVIRSSGTYRYYAHRDYAGATAQYQKLALLQPNDASVFNSLGLILRRQGHWAESLTYSQRACDLEPANISYLRSLGQSLRAVRRWDEYRQAMHRMMVLTPDDGDFPYFMAAEEFEMTGSLEAENQALAAMSKAVSESPMGIYWRKSFAGDRDDFPEFKRLDLLQPDYEHSLNPDLDTVGAGAMYRQHESAAAAAARVAKTLSELRGRLAQEPNNAALIGTTAGLEAVAGNSAEGMRLALRAASLMPVELDAVDGPTFVIILAHHYANVGDGERSLANVRLLLQRPSNLTVTDLKTDFVISQRLGADPRFQALVNDPKNNQPLF